MWSQPQWMEWVDSRIRQGTRDTGWRLHGLFTTALHQYVRHVQACKAFSVDTRLAQALQILAQASNARSKTRSRSRFSCA